MRRALGILVLIVPLAGACGGPPAVRDAASPAVKSTPTRMPAALATASPATDDSINASAEAASQESANPTGEPASVTQPVPTPTLAACLDEAAQPRDLPLRQTPLEVRFISAGNVWAWEEAGGIARQLSNTGDARSFSFAPDGKVIAFTRGPTYGQIELWGIGSDGTNLRRLVSAGQLHTLAGELSAWAASPQATPVPEGLLSPDGSQVALISDTAVSLMNADGSNLRPDVLRFMTAPVHEGGGTVYPHIAWAKDSLSLLALTFRGDVYSEDTPITTWRIPLDGTPAGELHTFSTLYFWVTLSPDQRYLAYLKRARPMINDYELHLAAFDGARDIVYLVQPRLEFLHWHPDSYHFVYHQWNTFRPFVGSVCGDSFPLLDTPDAPATQIEWVDANRFLYVKGPPDPSAGPRDLRLGQLGGPSRLIGPYDGESAQYYFNAEQAALGQDCLGRLNDICADN